MEVTNNTNNATIINATSQDSLTQEISNLRISVGIASAAPELTGSFNICSFSSPNY